MSAGSNGNLPFWRQPLVHFLVAGAAIFALNELRDPPEPAGSNRIVVTVAAVERMAGLWQKTWGRPPSESELQAQVRDYIKEEIYYREALRLGLDVNDTVIRRRLRQKMEFMTDTDAEVLDLDKATLQAFYEQNADRYRKSPVFDFEQIYFSAESADRIAPVMKALLSGTDSQSLGDPISLPALMTGADELAIARTFGSAFFAGLQSLEPNAWSGPVTSGFGQHLVKISRKEPARRLTLDEAFRSVENDWRAAQRIASLEAAFEKMRAGYEIEIEAPE
ncbi:MAG: peptidylprolyl isomerase [Gammaproteobacteria bacterium]|nr:peptidylprolyl isomerase [Gammaproteobacteria bacterium]MDH3480179.1 peptidylprolyl isomerase [Gammaproteobacteria bacterium]